MSKLVAVGLQVCAVAVPETCGVHWKTASGAPAVALTSHDPASALAPLVTPGNVPPTAGIIVGVPQVPAGTVVVVEVVVGVLDVVVEAVPVVVVCVVDVGVVVVVVPGTGAVTVSLKPPAEPPPEPLKPSTTMK